MGSGWAGELSWLLSDLLNLGFMVGDVTLHVNAGVCNTFISFYLDNAYPATHYLSYPFPLLFISVVVLKCSCQVVAAMRMAVEFFSFYKINWSGFP